MPSAAPPTRLTRGRRPRPAGRRRAPRRARARRPPRRRAGRRGARRHARRAAMPNGSKPSSRGARRREPLQHLTGVGAVPPSRAAGRPRRVRPASRDRDRRAAGDRRARGRGIARTRSPSTSAPEAARSPSRWRPRCPHARVFAAENSVDAFVWTKENFAAVGADNATLAFIDLERAFPELDGTVSVVVSNPPYVPDDAIPRDPEVRLLRSAGGALRRRRTASTSCACSVGVGLAPRAPRRHDRDRARRVAGRGDPRDLLTADGWRAAATHPDLTMRDRATTAIRP